MRGEGAGLMVPPSPPPPRRERIKHSCEQLRALVPSGKGRKNDAASVLEATVEHVKRVRDRIPPAVLGQVLTPSPGRCPPVQRLSRPLISFFCGHKRLISSQQPHCYFWHPKL